MKNKKLKLFIVILVFICLYMTICFILTLKKALTQPHLVSETSKFYFMGYYMIAFLDIVIGIILLLVLILLLKKLKHKN